MTVDYTKIAEKMNKQSAKKAAEASENDSGAGFRAVGAPAAEPQFAGQEKTEATYSFGEAGKKFTLKNILAILAMIIAINVFGELLFIILIVSIILFASSLKSKPTEEQISEHFLARNLRNLLEAALPPAYALRVKRFFRENVLNELMKAYKK